LAVHAAHTAPEFVSANHGGGTSRRQFLLSMGMLVSLAWLTLWIWEQSPYGRYLDHGRWTEIGLAGSICRVLPNGTVVLPALIYVGGWVLMTVAMMLPTTIPLLEVFRRLTRRRQDTGRLVTLVMVGYLTV
jgi:predicted metal-binding membrane protein